MAQKRLRCFISHGTGDPAVEALKTRQLPLNAEPFLFPRIAEREDIGITAPLMEAIRDCDLLVYINTDKSLSRYYVGFERSYAARIGKPVYAYVPEKLGMLFQSPFEEDKTPVRDPVVSLLVNLQVKGDVARVLELMNFASTHHSLQFFGKDRRQVDDEPRHLLDSVDAMQEKLKEGAIALLFLSTESIESPYHDYADAFTAHRARKDFESPAGYTSARFAALPPERTMVIWLDRPDPQRIEAALAKLDPKVWPNYIRAVRNALHDDHSMVPFQADGAPDLVKFDYMIARACWQALDNDPRLRADYAAKLRDRGTLADKHFQQFGINRPGML